MTSDTEKQRPLPNAFNPRDYFHHFEGEEITEEQMREFLTLYWSIIVECVSLGLDLAPGPEKPCVQLSENGSVPELPGETGVQWDAATLKTILNEAARGGKDVLS